VAFLLDTNVVSETRRGGPNANVLRWFASVDSDDLYISALVLGELRQGIERLRPRAPERAAEFEAWLDTLERDYADRIVPITAEVADEWGRLNARKPLPVIDSLLAATARVHGWTLVTRNRKDVEPTGVDHVDPFAD
jgi:predicted nucleic acid-binding protein